MLRVLWAITTLTRVTFSSDAPIYSNLSNAARTACAYSTYKKHPVTTKVLWVITRPVITVFV